MADNLVTIASDIAEIIRQQERTSGRLLVAIDGRCAAGKTTLAEELQRSLNCEVVHMDHFFLRPEQRSQERLEIPGENIDHERFLQEVLLPLYEGRKVSYRPFNCKTFEFDEPLEVKDDKIYIIEGSYSCHVSLREYYDLRIFLSVEPVEQMRRIIARNGYEAAEMFRSKWIPLEERYFEKEDIAAVCDCLYTT